MLPSLMLSNYTPQIITINESIIISKSFRALVSLLQVDWN